MPPRESKTRIIDWLLSGDASIRWQTLRDLAGVKSWRTERRKVATSGWGLRLIRRQRPDGHWGRGPYQPKWTCTTYSLQLLWQMGLAPRHPAALSACERYVVDGLGDDGGANFWRPRRQISETCVTGMVFGQLCYFGVTVAAEEMLDYLLAEQLADGGWNCMRPYGATHSSFHTTISVLEGLREYGDAGGRRGRLAESAADRGREFLLEHQLFKSHRTGRVVAAEMNRFHFPPHWRYDLLRGLDYFQSVNAPRDERLEAGLTLLNERRGRDGRWALARGYPGTVHFVMEVPGAPSRWNTLRALRILNWWRGQRALD
jgi:hypothetical protein